VEGVVVPDAISPAIGWRVWLVVAHAGRGLRLHSVVQSRVEWPVRRELGAVCRRSPVETTRRGRPAGAIHLHSAPGDDCGAAGHGCGIYATKALDDCEDYLHGSYSPSELAREPVVHRVYGRVALWGKVIEAERGWRAQLAYPMEIVVPATLHIAAGPETGIRRAPALPLAQIAAGLEVYGVPIALEHAKSDALAA
jgi:hypothetical protein